VNRVFCQDEEKIETYYEYCRKLKKLWKKNIKRGLLVKLCDFGESDLGFKNILKNKENIKKLSPVEFSRCIRLLIRVYLKEVSIATILTSKKMRS
jgi:hypothetical protein